MDYKHVLSIVVHILPYVQVEKFVIDFEDPLWRAIMLVFQDKDIKGCAYHCTQAVYRKLQELGPSTAYRKGKFNFNVLLLNKY